MGHCLSKDSAAGDALSKENDEPSSNGLSVPKKTPDPSIKGQRIVKEDHFSGIARIELIQVRVLSTRM